MADNDEKKDTVENTEESSSAEATEENQTSPEEAQEAAPEAAAEAPKEEAAAPAEEKKDDKPKKAVSANLEEIIGQIEKLSVLELADLVHALEDRFGVTAAAPMAVAAAAPAASGNEGPAEEQTSFNVVLTSGGANKIAVIKAVREIVPTLGLKEAKDLVEGAPKPVVEGVGKDAANEAKDKLTAAGGTVELQ